MRLEGDILYAKTIDFIHYTVQRQIFEPHNFRVFRGWHRTSKIKLRKILEYLIDAHMRYAC